MDKGDNHGLCSRSRSCMCLMMIMVVWMNDLHGYYWRAAESVSLISVIIKHKYLHTPTIWDFV